MLFCDGTTSSSLVVKTKAGGLVDVTMIFGGEQSDLGGIGHWTEQVLPRIRLSELSLHADDGIGEDDEVGTITCVLDGIRTGGHAIVRERGENTRDVATGRKAPRAQMVRRKAEVSGLAAQQPHGTLGIIDGRRVAVGRNTIVQYEGSDTALREPLRRCGAFAVRHDLAVAAAGNYQDGSVGGIGGGKIDIDRGTIRVGMTERSGRGAGVDIESLSGDGLCVQQDGATCRQEQQGKEAHCGKCNCVLPDDAVMAKS